MKKYLLTFCTLFIHTFTSHPKLTIIKIIDKKDSVSRDIILQRVKDEKNYDDSVSLIKKGGIHSATWYNPHGSRTASGERFHKDSLTCAYNFSKMKALLKVTNLTNNKSIVVRVTDRMGNKSNNHIDLSKCAFDSIGNPRSGRIKVIVEELK